MFVLQVSNKRRTSLKVTLYLLILYFVFFAIFIDKKIYVPFVFFMLFFSYSLGYFAYNRTIYLDKNGCTIKCGIFKKNYLWTEIKSCKYFCFPTKSKIKANNRPAYKNSHGIEFFFKPKKRRNKVNPLNYLERHPFNFSYVFVTFPYKPTMYKKDYIQIRETNVHYYFVDEQELFVKKLKEWGLVIDGIENMYIPTWDK